jgi:hypothetical protein
VSPELPTIDPNLDPSMTESEDKARSKAALQEQRDRVRAQLQALDAELARLETEERR